MEYIIFKVADVKCVMICVIIIVLLHIGERINALQVILLPSTTI